MNQHTVQAVTALRARIEAAEREACAASLFGADLARGLAAIGRLRLRLAAVESRAAVSR